MAKVSVLFTVSAPTSAAPGASEPPVCTVVAPPTVPVPPRVAVSATVTAPPATEPLIRSVPALTVVVPV